MLFPTREIWQNKNTYLLGTVRKYLKFFLFSLREKGGRGLRHAGNTKPEEKLEENREEGGGEKIT